MNAHLFSNTSSTMIPRSTRATLSPIRSVRRSATPAMRTLAPAEIGSAEAAQSALRPAWHRSPLDRLQPILTRYRD